jgi:hypothetical protein
MENNLIDSDCTILIRGKITQDYFNKYLLNYYNNKIIISTWVNEFWVNSFNLHLLNQKKHSLILNMTNDNDLFDSFQNLYYQIKTVYTALNSINSKYLIILRGDEYYSNLKYIYKEIKDNPKYVHCSPVFFRPENYIKYHFSDHIIAGTTENLKLMFAKSYENFFTKEIPISLYPEVYLTTNYLYNKYLKSPKVLNEEKISCKRIMKNNFSILNLELLKPYNIVFNRLNLKWNNNFIPEENNSISKMEDY